MKTKLITYPGQENALDKQGHFEFTFRNGKILRASASDRELELMLFGFPLTILLYAVLHVYDMITAP